MIDLRRFRTLCAAVALTALALFATQTFAATAVSVPVTVSWTAPTVDANGNPIVPATAVTSYRVWLSTSPIPDSTDCSTATPTVTVDATATTISQPISAGAGATLYARVASVNAGGCTLSAQATGVLTVPAPGAPTSVVIHVSLTGP